MGNWTFQNPINEIGASVTIDEGTLARTETALPGSIGLNISDALPKGVSRSEWNQIHHYKYPVRRKMQCCFFWTSNTKKNNAPKYTSAANKLLKEHNLLLDVCSPGTEKTAECTINFNELVDLSHYQELRELVHKKHYQEGYIPIIFCRFAGALGGESDTLGHTVKIENWLPFILINVDKNSIDGVTLLHEIGHVSKCGHMKSKADDAYPNFMSYPPPKRTGIQRNQVIKLAKSYFSRDA